MTMKTTRTAKGLLLVAAMLAIAPASMAQQKIGYIDSNYILEKLPEYAQIQQQIDRLASDWERELDGIQNEVEEMFRNYQARELLYTPEERKTKQDEIVAKEDEMETMRMRYFGPEGELFRQQETLMRPLQERILTAIEAVSTREGYDFVFDKGGDYVFVFTRDQYDLSDLVLEELGIDLRELGNQ